VIEVVGIAGDAVRLGLGESVDRQLGEGRRRDRHHAGTTDAGDELGVSRRRSRDGTAAVGGDVSGQVELVLDGDRHPEQRAVVSIGAALVGLGRCVECLVGEQLHDGVQACILALDGGEGRHRELAGGQGTGSQHGDLLGGPRSNDFVDVHDGTLLAVIRTKPSRRQDS
jgi:hypothetical protein